MFVVATITPFGFKREIDFEAFGWLLSELEKNGVDGVFVAGTTGEWPLLTSEERVLLAKKALDTLSSRTKVFLGVSMLRPEDSYKLAENLSDLGVDYVFSTPPLYYKPSDNYLKNYYLKLARHAGKPVFIYTIPERVGYNVPVSVVRQLALESTSIKGIKATVNDTSYIGEIVLKVKDERKDFVVLSGGEHQLAYTLSLGGDGSVSAMGNIMPKLGVSLLGLWRNKNIDDMIKLQKTAVHLTETIKKYGGFPEVVKSLLSIMGAPIKEYVREPLESASDVYMLASYLCNNYKDYMLDSLKCV